MNELIKENNMLEQVEGNPFLVLRERKGVNRWTMARDLGISDRDLEKIESDSELPNIMVAYDFSQILNYSVTLINEYYKKSKLNKKIN